MNHVLHVRTLFLLAIAAFLLTVAFRSLRAGRLKERFVLLFVLTGVPFLVFAAWPDLIVLAERTLEIEKPTLLVLCVTTYFILVTFELLSLVSVQDRKITTLGQDLAIAMDELRRLQADRPLPPGGADRAAHSEAASSPEVSA